MSGIPNDPMREGGADETRVIEAQPTVPVPRPAAPTAATDVDATMPIPRQAPSLEPEVLLRFGPGVPPARPARPDDEASPPSPSRNRRWHVLNLVLTGALALVVLWLLWPSQTVEVRSVAVSAPPVVGCEDSADVVATLQTNGRAGTVRYRWVRNDGVTSGVLTASPARGRTAVDVHLRWAFTGPGTYAAQASIEVLEPQAKQAATAFTYRC